MGHNVATGRARISALSPGKSHVAVYEAPGQQTHASFLLAHEGLSFPRIEGDVQNSMFTWTAEGLQSLGDAIQPETPIYRGHESRRQIGSVIGSYLERDEGGIRSVMVGRFPGGIDPDINTCSLEADIEYNLSDNSVRDVLAVTGVAVESRSRAIPGFPGARIMGKSTFLQPRDKEVSTMGDENRGSSEATPSMDRIERMVRDMQDQIRDVERRVDARPEGLPTPEPPAKVEKLLEKLEKLELQRAVQDWPSRLDGLIPEGTSDQQANFVRLHLTAAQYGHLDDDQAKLAVEKAIQDDYPSYVKLFPGSKSEAAAPAAPEESSQSEESIVDRAYQALFVNGG